MVLSRITTEDGRLRIEPLTSGGNPKFGGDDVTELIIQHIVNACCERLTAHFKETAESSEEEIRVHVPYIKQNHRIPNVGNRDLAEAIDDNSRLLYYVATDIKLSLTQNNESGINVNTLYYVVGSSNNFASIGSTIGDLDVRITRDQFNELIKRNFLVNFRSRLLIANQGMRNLHPLNQGEITRWLKLDDLSGTVADATITEGVTPDGQD